MREFTIAFALACMLSTIGITTAQQGSQNDATPTEAATQIVITYPVGDLPVWSENGKEFDASILIALLKAKITPGQWNGKNSINPFAEKALLVVNTTREAHEAIAANLAELRKD